jgi:hypothetical protein
MNPNSLPILAEIQIAEWHQQATRDRTIAGSRSATRSAQRASLPAACARRWEPGIAATVRWLSCRLTRATA